MRTVGVEIVGAIGRRSGRRVIYARGVSVDSRSVEAGQVFFALTGARVDGHTFVREVLERGAAAAVVSRPLDLPEPLLDRVVLVPDVLRALGESAREHRRRWNGLVLGVTGSNGKTTTREMIHHILSDQISCKRSPKSYNTNVGVPLTLFEAEPADRALIVEMGTNAPGEIAELAAIAEPNAGLITCIAETHLEGLGSLEGVARAKGELLQALGMAGTAFLNADDNWLDSLRNRHTGRTICFGMGERAGFRGENLTTDEAGSCFTARGRAFRLNVPGRHNVMNSLAALSVAEHLGLDLERAATRLETFRLPDMRYQMEMVRGIHVVFDGYNANPGSVRSALRTFGETPVRGRRAAVLGDMLELGPQSESLHGQIGREAARCGLNALWAVGAFSAPLADAARDGGLAGDVRHGSDVDTVAEEVLAYLRPGDALLVKGSRGMKLERLVEKLRGFAG